jgi:uncharacterized protein YkwD
MNCEVNPVMRKRFFLLLLIFILVSWSSAACSSQLKMVSREVSGTATLTPFLLKATYTSESPPLKEVGDPAVESSGVTSTAEPTLSEKTSEMESTEMASVTPSATPTPDKSPSQPTATPAPTKPPATTKPTKPPADTNTPKPPADTSTPEPPADTNTPKPPTATPECIPSGNNSYEQQVITLINQERAAEGLSPLAQNSSLTQAARRHSADMACTDTWSHTGSDGSTPSSRVSDAGYSWSRVTENIAASSYQYFSPASVVNMWMNSPGHKANILDENVIHIGVGFRYFDNGGYEAYYTADFARP